MCEWRSRVRTDYKCQVPAQPGSRYCILHEPGPKSLSAFRSELGKQLAQDSAEGYSNPRFDFTGYWFPCSVGIQGSEAVFVADDAVLLPKRLDADVWFLDAHIEGGIFFDNAEFGGVAVFSRAVVEWDAHFFRAEFKKGALFLSTRFSRLVDFGGTVFLKDVMFEYCVAGNLSFESRELSTNPFHAGRDGDVRLRTARSRFEFWTFAQRVFEAEGARDRADAAFFYARAAKLQVSVKRVAWWKKPLLAVGLGLDFLLLRLTTAYGASLARLVGTWCVLVGIFAVMYYTLNQVGVTLLDLSATQPPNLLSFGRALYFSIVTFTTLGFGDIVPQPGLGSALVAAEAVLGGITMALTVMVVGRKFMR